MWERLTGVAVVLVLGGAWLMIAGGFQRVGYYMEYTIGFGEAGDSCGIHVVQLDTRSGSPMYCGSRSTSSGSQSIPSSLASFAGFTDEQNSQVLNLATSKAGSVGLTKPEQREIQDLVDSFAAPLADKHGFWWGTRNLLVGAGAAGLGIRLYFVFKRRIVDDGPGIPLSKW
ncbi:hypothetical protein OG474_33290 [Kribbella sp. NBC_01505]|uniref:hypothetical protein n=1 Tax=Kribbella sp. NBC_01505 TaxID=2903580 RepID=UPI00386BB8F2